MSEIEKQAQVLEANEIEPQNELSNDVDKDKRIEELTRALEETKKQAAGQDKKNSELYKKLESLEKIVSEKDQTKKSLEEQMEELRNEMKQRDQLQKQKEKEVLVSKIIAKHKLDPSFDFDALIKFETEEMIEEKALERVNYYNKLKEDGFKERAGGSIPKSGSAVPKDLSSLSLMELNRLAMEKPELLPQITEAIKRK